MAISLGTTSEQLLRGIDRMVASVASVLPIRVPLHEAKITRAWEANRGRDRLVAQVDVAGGFPGGLRWQNRLTATTLHLTDRHLIVGEGTKTGFAVPLANIAGSAIQLTGGLKPPCLTVWFLDGALIGSFSVNFRGTSRGRSGLLRAEVWQQHLAEFGVPAVETERARFSPNLHLDWDEIHDIVDDEIIFSGTVIASVGGWFASELDEAELWITEHSIIWCGKHGEGVNRLAIDRIVNTRNGYGDRIAIGIEDSCGGRYDLFFDFGNKNDRDNPGARVHQILGSMGVPISAPTTIIAPWRRGGTRRPTDI